MVTVILIFNLLLQVRRVKKVVMSEERYVQGQIVRTMVGCQWWYKWLYVKKGAWFCIKLSVVPIPPLMVPPENV